MDEAARLGDDGAPEGTVVVAEEQTAGRGRFDRRWVTRPGDSLSLSVLLRPTAGQLPHVNMASALAVAGAITDTTGLVPALKWPNDVRIQGRKVSGILIEAAIDGRDVRYAVSGIGLNVNYDPSRVPGAAPEATSLARELGRNVSRTEVLGALLERLDDLYQAVKAGESLRTEWAGKLDTLGQRVHVRWKEQVVEGVAEDVDEQGDLLLRLDDGSRFVAIAGEVTLQEMAS